MLKVIDFLINLSHFSLVGFSLLLTKLTPSKIQKLRKKLTSLHLHREPAPTSIPTFQCTLRWEQLICPRVLDLVSCKQDLSMKGLIIDSMALLDLSLATVFSCHLKPLLSLKQIAFFSLRESIIPPYSAARTLARATLGFGWYVQGADQIFYSLFSK